MKLGSIKVMDKKIDLCEDLFKGTSVQCPVEAGPVNFVKTIDYPSNMPKVRV